MASSAFAPANGSLIFETYEATPHYGRGSLGVGFTLDGGVRVKVTRLSADGDVGETSRILVHGEPWEFTTVRDVIRRLAKQPVTVEITADFEFGCGFGMSGASALATAYALGEEFSLAMTPYELAMVAHEAEVDNSTGRGDVGGQFNGGFMVKTRKGRPLDVEWLPIDEVTVHCVIFGPISTKEVLHNQATMQKVNAAGRRALDELGEKAETITLEGLLELSCRFARESGLMTSQRVLAAVAEAEKAGGRASMVMLGEAVVSSVPISGSRPWRVLRQAARIL